MKKKNTIESYYEANLCRQLIQAQCGAVIIAQNNTIKYVNPKAEELFELPKNKLLNQKLSSFIAPECRHKFICSHIKKKISTKKLPAAHELEIINEVGRKKIVECNCYHTEFQGEDSILFVLHDISEYRKVEQDILREKKFLNNIIDLNPYAVQISDNTGHIIRVNKAYMKLFRFKGEKPPLENYNWFEDPIAKQRGLHDYQQLIKKGKVLFFSEMPYNPSWVMPNLPNIDLIFNATAFPIMDENDKLDKFVLLFEDVTERKKAESALIKSEINYRTLAEISHDMIFVINKDLTIDYVNKFAAKQFKTKPQNIIGLSLVKNLNKYISKKQIENLKKVFKRGKSLSIESEMTLPTRRFWLETDLEPIRDWEGNIIKVMGVSRDVTKRKKLEAERQIYYDRAERVSAMVENVFEALAAVDLGHSNLITYVNSAWEKLFGYRSAEVVGKKIGLIVEAAKRDGDLLAKFNKAVANGSNFSAEMQWRVKNGKLIDVEVFTAPIRDKNGKITTWFNTIRDISRRKLAEKLLKESEFKYRELFENMKGGVAVYESKNGRDFIFSDFNRGAEIMEGVSRKKLIGKNVEDVFPGVGPMGLLAVFKRVWKTGKSEELPEALYKDHVSPMWRYNYVYKLPDGKVVAVYEDITKRKISEQNLKDSEERFRRVFENGPLAMALTDLKTHKFFKVNKKLCNLLGYKKEELVGLSFVDITHPDDVNKDISAAQKMFRGETSSYETEKRYIKKNGDIVWINLVAATMPAREDIPVYSVAMIKDITDQKINEQKIKEHTIELERLNLCINNASDQIVIIDIDGKIIFANEALKTVTGYSPKEVIGKNPSQFWGGHMSKEYYEKMWQTIKVDKKAFVGEVKNIRKSGQEYIAKINISPVLDKNGDLLSFVAIERDVTEAVEIDRAKTEFVSIASHQLRTPLSIMRWYSEVLLKNRQGHFDDKELKYLKEIYEGNLRLIKLVGALLNVSRIEMGMMTVSKKLVDLEALSDIVISDLESLSIARQLTIQKEYAGDLRNIYTDPQFFSMILENLISNSLQYTNPGGVIKISIKHQEDIISIDVIDNGIGIPKFQQSKIFEKLFRADNARQYLPAGTGLGLYIVKSLVENLRGKIWFESDEGKGTTFHILLLLNSGNHLSKKSEKAD